MAAHSSMSCATSAPWLICSARWRASSFSCCLCASRSRMRLLYHMTSPYGITSSASSSSFGLRLTGFTSCTTSAVSAVCVVAMHSRGAHGRSTPAASERSIHGRLRFGSGYLGGSSAAAASSSMSAMRRSKAAISRCQRNTAWIFWAATSIRERSQCHTCCRSVTTCFVYAALRSRSFCSYCALRLRNSRRAAAQRAAHWMRTNILLL
mmetsp:Transcript_54520/g.167882  ORF Transcript_54520/g.167882 Transcript_54520/m.167882 type:complete len:208 (+) Transcript_54520:337-960(+)